MLLNLLPVFLLAEIIAVVQAAPLLQDGVKSLFDRGGGAHRSWGGSARRGGKFPEIGSPGESYCYLLSCETRRREIGVGI